MISLNEISYPNQAGPMLKNNCPPPLLNHKLTVINHIIHKWRKHGTVENLPRSGLPTKITPRTHRQLIKEVTKEPRTTKALQV